jgi:hypothetical protein
LQQIVAIQNQGDRDALAGGQSPEGWFVVRDHICLGADLRFCSVHDEYGVTVMSIGSWMSAAATG